MAIFQKSVIKKHLRGLNTAWLNTAYDKFNEIFTPKKIDKIIKLKEEEYQDGFLRDLFVEVLGYTLKPDDDFNLVREFKNQTDGKKADGAIIKDETRFHEKNISEQLYKDYSGFKAKIFENIVKNNPEKDKLTLFKKSQKLLDRLLFIFFAEDCGLLPANSISRIIERYEQLKKLDAYKPLYEIYLQYFSYMNIGRKGQIPADDIPAYNGGLFAPDELLDNIKIDDKILKADSLKLSAYDFNTDVDVNILGHIFEHSLNEIEEVAKNLTENPENKPTASKRKKDGVFYTPKYITEYIVNNTIGTLCTKKRKEMQIYEIEFDETHKTKKGLSKKGKQLFKKFNDYKEWLKSLKILDPACGSGAFLNQSLQFLIAEHKLIDELIADLTGDAIGLFDTDKSILENNLYGVDINEESVEIAKLSLWLRTAQKGRKLSNLNNNIKCGNSLIDDPEVAGDKAFDWNIEFKEIMDNGGFDVVIGNPPYVRVEFISPKHVDYYKTNYKTATSKFDLSSIFYEKSIALLNKFGLYSVITSYQFVYASSGIGLRKFISNNTSTSIIMFSSDSQVFEGATTYAGIFISKKNSVNKIKILKANNKFQQINITEKLILDYKNFTSNKVIVADVTILQKIMKNTNIVLGSNIGIAKTGVVTSADDVFFIDEIKLSSLELERKLIYPIIGSSELSKWYIENPKTLCLYPYSEQNNKTILLDIEDLKKSYPKIHEYLLNNRERLTARSQGRKDYSDSPNWYQLNRPREKWIYDSVKIIYPGTTNSPKFALDKDCQLFRNARVYAYLLNEPSIDNYLMLLPILNSKLTGYLISLKCPPKANNYYEMSTGFMDNFPFIIPKNKNLFIEKADKMLFLNKELQNESDTFLKPYKKKKISKN